MSLKRGRVAVCGVGVLAATFWSGQPSDLNVGTIEPASAVRTAPLPGGFDRHLAGIGITYTVLGDATDGQVNAARESVLGGFDGFLDGDARAVVMRVRFTDKSYGHVDDPDAPNPVVTPYFTDREALMVVLAHQMMPVSGPPNADVPESMEGTFVAFVDRKTSEVLTAVSWSP